MIFFRKPVSTFRDHALRAKQYGQAARAAHGALRPGDRRLWVETEIGDMSEPLLERDPDLHARKVRPDAAVDAEAEGGVTVLLAVEDDAVSLGKFRRITVGGRKGEQHHVPRREGAA